MAAQTEAHAANANGEANGSAGVWSRLEGARGALTDGARNATQVAGRQLSVAQRRVVGTVREKPVTVSLATAGLALLAAGAVLALRNPDLLRSLAGRVEQRFRRG